jgi:DNA-binding transcriptional MerR regulator
MLSYRLIPTADLIPYARNSRTHSDAQISKIASSIREFGFINPVVTDGKNGIVAGHGRVMAANKLGLKEIPCVEASHLTEAQKRAYVIADNRMALDAGWDADMLKVELGELQSLNFDLALTGFELSEIKEFLSGASSGLAADYTHKVDAPVYQPKGEKPQIGELLDRTRADELIQEIENSKVPKDVAAFLKAAASRHVVFNFEKIAEFYCHADKQTQALMENSALVIIDFKKAMQLGYVKLKEEIAAAFDGSQPEDDEEDEQLLHVHH